ncbi:MAG: exo-alpha-sialidase [Fimbriimonas sp.]
MQRRILVLVLLLALSAPLLAQTKSQPYRWKSVQMVGGGFVDGIVFHPTAKGVRYARTDIGGAYRWDDRARRWTPLLDFLGFEDTNLMGVESIAVDPADASRVYLACGTYTNPRVPDGAIFRSRDRGRTFQRTDVPFKLGGNENGRGNGERLTVDPNDGRVLFFGTRHAGLWRSDDGAATWRRVEGFPAATVEAAKGVGINVVLVDPRGGKRGGPSRVVYAAVSVMGGPSLFRSLDGGTTWSPVPGQPTNLKPTHMVLARDGFLYLTYGTDGGPNRMRDGAVWRLDTAAGEWTNITPDRPDATRMFGYAAVAVDAKDPKTLIASSFFRPGGEEIFRSRDRGATWRPVLAGTAQWDYTVAPYVARTGIHWLFDVEIDPADPDHAIFTTGYGGHETFNLTAADRGLPTKWHVMSKGIEETVALDLVSPPQGPPLVSAIGDYGGFVHWDLDRPAPEGNFDRPHFGNTTGLAYAENAPNLIVRVGRGSGNRGGGNIGYSVDSGRTWRPTASTPVPNAALGRIAVSADGAKWIWTLRDASYLTQDRGLTWTRCQGLPEVPRVVADRIDPRRFYALSLFAGKLYTSVDGGKTFAEAPVALPGGLPVAGGDRGDNRGGQDHLYATPGRSADLWIAAYEGLHRSRDGGKAWTTLPGVEQIHAFGFGKAAPRSTEPALFLVGVVRGLRGIYRSDDAGASWIRINDPAHQWGLLLQITGDPRIHGRAYVGTHGRGTLYGDP